MATSGKLWRHGHCGPPGGPPPNLPVRGRDCSPIPSLRTLHGFTQLSARLGTCSSLELQECDCGAFRSSGMERRVKPFSPPKPPDFMITSAARFLRVLVSTMMRLLARGTIHGAKVRVPGHPLLQGSVALREQGTRPLPRKFKKTLYLSASLGGARSARVPHQEAQTMNGKQQSLRVRGALGFFLGAVLLGAVGTAASPKSQTRCWDRSTSEQYDRRLTIVRLDLTLSSATPRRSANTASGAVALFSNTTGAGNTASGLRCPLFNTTASPIPPTELRASSEHYRLRQHRQWRYGARHQQRATSTPPVEIALKGNSSGSDNTASGTFRPSTATPPASTTPPTEIRPRLQHYRQLQYRQRSQRPPTTPPAERIPPAAFGALQQQWRLKYHRWTVRALYNVGSDNTASGANALLQQHGSHNTAGVGTIAL